MALLRAAEGGATGAATAWNAEETVSAEEFAQSAVEEIAQPADPVPDAYDDLDTEVARAEKNGGGPGAADQTAVAETAAGQETALRPEAPARPAAPPAAPEQTPDPAHAQPEPDASETTASGAGQGSDTASGTGAASETTASGADANADPDDAVIDEDAEAEAAAATQFPPIPARPTTLPRFPNRD